MKLPTAILCPGAYNMDWSLAYGVTRATLRQFADVLHDSNDSHFITEADQLRQAAHILENNVNHIINQ